MNDNQIITSLDLQKFWIELERAEDVTVKELAMSIFSAFTNYENKLKSLNYIANAIKEKAIRVKNETNNGLMNTTAGAYINRLGELQSNALSFDILCSELHQAKNEYNNLVNLFAKVTSIENVLDYKIQ
jgi:hypothetical protein